VFLVYTAVIIFRVNETGGNAVVAEMEVWSVVIFNAKGPCG
jgi:hypothetical protein